MLILVLVLGLFLSISRSCKGRRSTEKIFKSNEIGYGNLIETQKQDDTSQFHKVPQGDELLIAFSVVISFT